MSVVRTMYCIVCRKIYFNYVKIYFNYVTEASPSKGKVILNNTTNKTKLIMVKVCKTNKMKIVKAKIPCRNK